MIVACSDPRFQRSKAAEDIRRLREDSGMPAAKRDAIDRFAGYGGRLREALEKVVAGEHEWFTKPVIDSYHTIWFELHEDLLCTLGIERASEGHS